MYTFHKPKELTLNTLKNSRYSDWLSWSCVIPIPCEILGGTEYAYKPNELTPTPICFQGQKTCLYWYTLRALQQVASKRTGPFCQSPQTTLGSRNPNFTAYIPNYMQLHYGQAEHTQQICQHVIPSTQLHTTQAYNLSLFTHIHSASQLYKNLPQTAPRKHTNDTKVCHSKSGLLLSHPEHTLYSSRKLCLWIIPIKNTIISIELCPYTWHTHPHALILLLCAGQHTVHVSTHSL